MTAPLRRTGFRTLWRVVGLVLVGVGSSWAILALGLSPLTTPSRIASVSAYVAVVGTLFRTMKIDLRRLSVWLGATGVVIAWFLEVSPPSGQAWAPQFARMPWAEVKGDQAVIHDVRNFSYWTENDFAPNWETRSVALHEIIGADLFLTHWGVPLIAHSMVSFRFADGSFLATSIEARRAVNQQFSAFRGFFRQFQVTYLMADERDVVRLRTNYRKHEEVYLYRTRLKPADARALFLRYLAWINAAHDRPEWYNALTRNCSTPVTSYLAKANVGGLSSWDWRAVLDGSGDKMLYQLGDLAGDDLPFAALKAQALINPVAHRADKAADFSRRIRAGRAGFED